MLAVGHALLLLHSSWAILCICLQGEIFYLFNPCTGCLFPCDGFPHLAARCCLFLLLYFISNPKSLSICYTCFSAFLECCRDHLARWWPQRACDASRDEEIDENDTMISRQCSSLRRYKWSFESCSHEGRRHFRSPHQQHVTFLLLPPEAPAAASPKEDNAVFGPAEILGSL